jgi:TonB-dependent starch-binding outer membrane protein SusC
MKRILTFAAAAALVISCGTAGKLASGPESSQKTESSQDPGDELLNYGYGKVKKKENTASISKLKVERGTSYTDIYDYIRGRVPGVIVKGTSIIIRGVTTLNASTDPLILVDGVEMSDISSIPPENVESIEVLKDGASTALYGFRGANGVILITLRSN